MAANFIDCVGAFLARPPVHASARYLAVLATTAACTERFRVTHKKWSTFGLGFGVIFAVFSFGDYARSLSADETLVSRDGKLLFLMAGASLGWATMMGAVENWAQK